MKKKNKKTNFPTWLKSKWTLLGAALVLAIIIIAGIQTFAAGSRIPAPCLGGTIGLGSRGSCVTAARKSLNYVCKGKKIGSVPKVLPPTGAYDANMRYRVQQFQYSAHIQNDGKMGPNTWRNLSKYNKKSKGSLSCDSYQTPY